MLIIINHSINNGCYYYSLFTGKWHEYSISVPVMLQLGTRFRFILGKDNMANLFAIMYGKIYHWRKHMYKLISSYHKNDVRIRILSNYWNRQHITEYLFE